MKKTTKAATAEINCDTSVHMLQASLEQMAGVANRISSLVHATGRLPELVDNEFGRSDVRNLLQVTQQIVEDLENEIEFALDYARKTTGKQCVAFPRLSAADTAVDSKINH